MATIVKDLGNYLVAGENLDQNDAIYIDSGDNKVYKFDVTDSAQVFAGFAKYAASMDDYVFIAASGTLKNFTGLTAGAFVYASTTTPGDFQLVEPVSSQKIVFGIAKSSSELVINGGLGIKPGGEGSGGGLDVYYTQDMEGLNDTSDFATGNNATFLGGGTLQGALAIETSSPISGTKSLKYTMAAGSLNDYFASPVIDLDLKQRANTSGMTLYFEYNGADNDLKFVVWDVTNGAEISNQVSYVKSASVATRYALSFYVPASCTQIRWGVQTLVANSGKILLVDDVEMSTNPFHESQLTNLKGWTSWVPTGNFTTNTTYTGLQKQVGSTKHYQIKVAFSGAPNSTSFEVNLPSGDVIDLSKTVFSTGGAVEAVPDSSATFYDAGVIAYPLSVTYSTSTSVRLNALNAQDIYTQNNTASQNIPVTIGAGDYAIIHFSLPILGLTDTTEHVLTPSSTFSTDTASLVYASSSSYTLSTLANAPIGTFITFTYAINTNTRTQTTTAPTQTTSDMNVNGIQIFTRAYNAASTAANPAVVAIQIGKGLKGVQLGLYKSSGKTTSGELERYISGTTSDVGVPVKSYNESTGILVIDCGGDKPTTITTAVLLFSDQSTQASGYFTINAGKTLPLLAVPTPLVAYLKDVKASSTSGGTFTSGAWQTRTLNTVEGDSQIVSLSSNQFTLQPGKYEIEASAPAFRVDGHQCKLYNITDAADAILGTPEYSDNSTADSTQSRSNLMGTLNLSSSKTFELQHRSQTTFATTGFGFDVTFGVSLVYSQVKIRKIG